MKLGDIRHRRAVQSLGRYDIGLPAAQARATTNLIATGLQVAGEIYEEHARSAVNDRFIQDLPSLNQKRIELNNKTTYHVDEVPEGLLPDEQLFDNVVDSEGNIQQVPKTNIPGFLVNNLLFDRYSNSMMESAKTDLGGLYKRYEQRMAPYVMNAQSAVFGRSAAQSHKYHREKAEFDGEVIIQNGGSAEEYRIHMEESGVFMPLEIESMTRAASQEIALNDVKEDMISEDVPAMMEHLEILSSENYKGPLSETQRLQLVGNLDRRIDSVIAEQEAKRKEAIGWQFAEEFGAITDGNGSVIPPSAEESRRKGYTPSQHMRLQGAYRSALAAQQKKAGNSLIVEEFLNGTGEPLSAADRRHREAMDDWSKIQMEAGNVEGVVNLAMETNYLNQPLENLIVSGALGQDMNRKEQALNAYGRLSEMRPMLMDSLQGTTKDYFATAYELSKVMPATQALQQANERMQVDSSTRSQLESEYKSITQKDNNSELASFMREEDALITDTVWGMDFVMGSADIDPQLKGDYNKLVRHHFLTGTRGDIDMARKMAWSQVKQYWGVTEVNGKKQHMKRAPEPAFGITSEQTKEALGRFADAHGFNRADVVIRSDPQTLTDPVPSYPVYVVDENGLVQLAYGPSGMGDGETELRFYPHEYLPGIYKDMQENFYLDDPTRRQEAIDYAETLRQKEREKRAAMRGLQQQIPSVID